MCPEIGCHDPLAACPPEAATKIKHTQIAHYRQLNPLVTDYGKYLSNEPRKAFDWPIHPEGFSAPELLELGKLQGCTLKPARMR